MFRKRKKLLEEQTKTNNLKGCPFCGDKAVVVRIENKDWVVGQNERYWFGVICTNKTCIAYDIEPNYDSIRGAIVDWNGRVK